MPVLLNSNDFSEVVANQKAADCPSSDSWFAAKVEPLAPVRIQRRRTKGWRMPENTVSVTRPGALGNPMTLKDAIEAGYRRDGKDPRESISGGLFSRLDHGCRSARRAGLVAR